MADHEILAATWALPPDTADPASFSDHAISSDANGGGGGRHSDQSGGRLHGGPVVDGRGWRLSDGSAASPLVWAPRLASPLGLPLQATGLRFVNRTDAYRCKE